jgi:hypothetical protein
VRRACAVAVALLLLSGIAPAAAEWCREPARGAGPGAERTTRCKPDDRLRPHDPAGSAQAGNRASSISAAVRRSEWAAACGWITTSGGDGRDAAVITALAGLSALFVVWWLSKLAARSDPKRLANLIKAVGGVLSLAVAALLAFRGRIDMAFLAGGVGAWLLGWRELTIGRWNLGRLGGPRAPSRLRSALVEIELDGRSGRVGGSVLAGPYAGRTLDELGPDQLGELRRACLRGDPDGGRLLEAYLDRRFPGWREHAEADPDSGRRADPQRGAMAEEEAYQVLGLQPGADEDAVRRAHRSLMKKLHPDQGGSTYLASRVNQAKDVLLNRHR